jgi:hypothetical protein
VATVRRLGTSQRGCRSPVLVGALPRRFAAVERACSSQVAAWEASADLFDFRPCLAFTFRPGLGLTSR